MELKREVDKGAGISPSLVFYIVVVGVLMFGVVLAVSWDSPIDAFNGFEGENYFHNVSENVTGAGENLSINLVYSENQLEVTWDNGIQNMTYENLDSLSWFNYNFTNFILSINASIDEQSGKFKIPFTIKDNETEVPVNNILTFVINATNDAPEFVDFQNSSMNYTDRDGHIGLNFTLEGDDEEGHYPLIFNITEFFNCTLAEWNPRNASEGNCSLPFQIFQTDNTTSVLSFENLSINDTGKYEMTICVNDNVSNVPVYHDENYNISQQSCRNFTLDLRIPLWLDASNCSGINMLDNETVSCNVYIETESHNSSVDVWSVAGFTEGGEYQNSNISNNSWLYSNNSFVAEDYKISFSMNITPREKYEVGFWEIVFSANDTTPPEDTETTPISDIVYVNVSRSANALPSFQSSIGSNSVPLEETENIYFQIIDKDFLIVDKRVYNESITLSYIAINVSNESQFKEFSNVSFTPESSPSYDMQGFYMNVYANESDVGEWTINLTATDNSSAGISTQFNLTISDAEPLEWNLSKQYSFECVVNSTQGDTISCPTEFVNLTSYLGNYIGENNISFNFSNAPQRFNITSENVINFTPWKEDVGNWTFNISVDDGYFEVFQEFNFFINNTNSLPEILELWDVGMGSNISNGSFYEIYELNETILNLTVLDEDLLIGSFYDEAITFDINITNTTSVEELQNFSFTLHSNQGNKTFFRTTFTPTKENVGNYTITIVATDESNESSLPFVFNLTIIEINSPPQLSIPSNQTKTIFNSFTMNMSSYDTDQDELVYNITNLTVGGDFLNITSEVVGEDNRNKTLIISLKEGVENLSEYAGFWEFNVSASETNTSQNYSVWKVFSLTVHGLPNVTSPSEGYQFNETENETFLQNFTIDYSINNTDLTYIVYMDNITVGGNTGNFTFNYSGLNLRENGSENWNSSFSNLSVNSSLGFNDETYNLLKNITLFIYPSEYPELNSSFNWKINVSHKNSPIFAADDIDDREANYNSEIEVDLKNHFSDLDFSDLFYEEVYSYNFTVESNETSSNILSSISEDWILILSTKIKGATVEKLRINASDLDSDNITLTSDSGNWFEVDFTSPQEIVRTITTSRTRTVPVSLKIIVPGTVTSKIGDIIVIPIELVNEGDVDLRDVNLSALVEKDGVLLKNIGMSFSEDTFDILRSGENESSTLEIQADLSVAGTYDITLYANSKNPEYKDWGKIQLILQEFDEFLERIIFAEEFIVENPECLEIKEIIDRARELYDRGDFSESLRLTNSAIDACRDAVNQKPVFPRKLDGKNIEDTIFYYLVILMISSIFLGLLYYQIKRIRFKKQ